MPKVVITEGNIFKIVGTISEKLKDVMNSTLFNNVDEPGYFSIKPTANTTLGDHTVGINLKDIDLGKNAF